MEVNSIYVIKDEFFEYFNDPYLKGNKEENRPHYYSFSDNKTGLYWIVPMSTRIEKYKGIMEKRISCNKPCDILHIARLDNDQESAFLIQDMFPITEKYIERPYTLNGVPMKITSARLISILEQKSRSTLSLIRRGIKFTPTQADVLKIETCLMTGKPFTH